MGWICPACGNENRFSDTECQVCGKKTTGLYRIREKRAGFREKELWGRTFKETEILFFEHNSGFYGFVSRRITSFSRQISVILLLLMLVSIVVDIILFKEQTQKQFPNMLRMTAIIQEKTERFHENSATFLADNTLNHNLGDVLNSLTIKEMYKQSQLHRLQEMWQWSRENATSNLKAIGVEKQTVTECLTINIEKLRDQIADVGQSFPRLNRILNQWINNAVFNLHTALERIQTFDLGTVF